MQFFTNNNIVRGTTAALLGGSASAAVLNPNVKLPGIAPIGNPSFQFDSPGGSYNNTIQNWFDNLVYVSRQKNKITYKVSAFNKGSFTYAASSDDLFAGTKGNFQLRTHFGKNGGLIGGRVVMTGKIKGLGINKNRLLFRFRLAFG